MLKPWTRYLLYVGTLPTDLVGWFLVSFVRLFWGAGLRWVDGVLEVTMRRASWPGRTWYAAWSGTTIGHAMILKEGSSPTLRTHELVHVEQAEAAGVVGAVLALSVVAWSWPLAIVIWCLTPALVYALSGVTALARGEDFYRGSNQEEAAYDREHRPS